MKKLDFLVYHREYESFLESLRSLGVVHVEIKQQGIADNAGLTEDLRILSKSRQVCDVLAAYAPTDSETGDCSAGTPDPGKLAELLDDYDGILAGKSQMEQQIAQLSRDRSMLEPWGDFDPQRIRQLASAGYVVRFWTCPLKSYRSEWEQSSNAIVIFSDKQKICFVTVTSEGQTIDIDAEECRLPSSSISQIDCQIAELKEKLDSVPASLSEMAKQNLNLLKTSVVALENNIALARVRLSGEKTCQDAIVQLEAWAPASKTDELSAKLDNRGIYMEVLDPQPDDNIPIQLENNRFARLFEPLTKLYMLPSYQELDLTLMFAPFFMLFFGLCLGDMGYGLLMIVALPIFTKLFQLINPNFSKWLVVLFGASTILCGTLSGTFFGFNIYDLNIPFIQSMKSVLYTDNSTMFTVSLCIGVVQILFGMALKAVNLTIQCGFKSAISTVGWLLLLITVGVCSLAGIGFDNPVVMVLLGIAGVGIFLLNSPGKNPLLNIGTGLWDTYNMATGLLGDVLSYVRLFALGLSGGILANVFNSMAIGMKPDGVVAGFIVMALIFVIGHALNIFMNILGAIVHPMRLTFVEFFKNAGYTGGGIEYRPFMKK